VKSEPKRENEQDSKANKGADTPSRLLNSDFKGVSKINGETWKVSDALNQANIGDALKQTSMGDRQQRHSVNRTAASPRSASLRALLAKTVFPRS